MSCPVDGRFTADLFQQAMDSFDLWEFAFCAYGSPLGELVVGTVIYAGVALNIFIRTGSVMIPFVLALILGGTVFAQAFAIINAFVALVILIAAPVVMTALVMSVGRRG